MENELNRIIKKIIEFGMYSVVFLLPWQTRWIIKAGEINGGYFEYGTISLYGTDALLVVLIFCFGYLKIKGTRDERRETNLECGMRKAEYMEVKSQVSFPFHSSSGKAYLKFKIPIIWQLIAALDLFIFISIFFAPDKTVAVATYARFLLGVGLFWLVTAAQYDSIKLICSFLAGIFLQATLGLWQFLTQASFASKWLGIAAHNPGDLGVSVVETLSGGRWLRAYGGLDHPNMLGGLVAIGILAAVYLKLRHKYQNPFASFFESSGLISSPWAAPAQQTQDMERGESENKECRKDCFEIVIDNSKRARGVFARNKCAKLFSVFCRNFTLHAFSIKKASWSLLIFFTFYLLLFTFLSALFFTFSRGAWAGMIVGLLIMLIIAVFFRDYAAQKKLLRIILAMGVFIFILSNLFSDLLLTRLSQDTRLEIKSNAERAASYQTALKLIKDHWLFGAGIGNFTQSMRVEIDDSLPAYYYQPAHNVIILAWGEIGMFGLLFFILLLAYPVIFNFKFLLIKFFENQKPKTKNLNLSAPPYNDFLAGLLLLIPMLAMFIIDHWWWSLHFGILLFWLMMGLANKTRGKVLHDEFLIRKRSRAGNLTQ